ncbi:MAG: BamA/TamA family outer membrane protein [Bacteroidales bacterium]
MNKTFTLIIILIIIITPTLTYADETVTYESLTGVTIVDADISVADENQVDSIDSTEKDKNLRFSILGGPGYTPDYGFLIGGSALMTFNLPGMEGNIKRSVLPIAFALSFGNSVGLSLMIKPQLFFNKDNMQLMGDFIYSNLGSNYYGVGYDQNKSVIRGSETTNYYYSQIRINPILLFRISDSNWFIGPTSNYQYDNISDPAQGMIDDPDYIAAGGTADGYSTQNNGIGFSVSYDTRDIPANAYKGIYFNLNALAYADWLGGEYNFQSVQFKYRQYIQLSDKCDGRTLAWSISSENIFGDAPFTRLSMLGSPFDLRGYYQGQYRDKSTHFAMVEYRHKFHVEPIDFWSKLANRFGFAAWAGSGFIGPSPIDIEGILPNFGAGLRIEVQPRMNFRVDIGYSPIDKQTLVYFNMTEAF